MVDTTCSRRFPALGGAILAVLGAAASTGVLSSCAKSEAAASENGASRAMTVETTEAQVASFRRTVVVQGNVKAKHYALVSPRLGGVLDGIFVDDGDIVTAGETTLFQTDAVKVAEAVEARRHEVAVAAASLREKQALLVEEQAEHDRVLYDWRKFNEMDERGASSDRELELAEAERKKAVAKVQHAEAIVALGEAQLAQAESYMVMAEKDLADSLVAAPISGRISARFKEPGEMGNPGEPVLRIDDTTVVEISVYLPAEVRGDILPGETLMHLVVNGLDLGRVPITYKSPTIDLTTRTFEARCVLRDPPATVAPGAMANVEVILDELDSLGVPIEAVQRRAGGRAVFVEVDGVARLVPVEVGLETAGVVQIISGALEPGAPVITIGGYFLDEGDAVRTAAEDD